MSEYSIDRTAGFTLSELDFRRAVRLHVFSSIREAHTIIRLLMVWVIAVGAIAVFCYAVLGLSWPEVRGILPIFALSSACAIGTVWVIPLVFSPLAIRRRFRQDKSVRQPITIHWNEEVYEAEQPGIHNRIAWRDYSKWREDRHLFLFFMSDYSYQILPKRVLNPEQIADLQRTLSAP